MTVWLVIKSYQKYLYQLYALIKVNSTQNNHNPAKPIKIWNLGSNNYFAGCLIRSWHRILWSSATWEGTQVIFWWSVWPEIQNPYPYLRIFLTQRMADSASKAADFIIFLQFLWNGTLFFFFFWPNWDPCLRIFGEKVTHLGSISPYALTCEYPSRICKCSAWAVVAEQRSWVQVECRHCLKTTSLFTMNPSLHVNEM